MVKFPEKNWNIENAHTKTKYMKTSTHTIPLGRDCAGSPSPACQASVSVLTGSRHVAANVGSRPPGKWYEPEAWRASETCPGSLPPVPSTCNSSYALCGRQLLVLFKQCIV